MSSPYRTDADVRRMRVEENAPAKTLVRRCVVLSVLLHAWTATALLLYGPPILRALGRLEPAPPRPSVMMADPVGQARDEERKRLESQLDEVTKKRDAFDRALYHARSKGGCRTLDGTIVSRCEPGDSLCTCD